VIVVNEQNKDHTIIKTKQKLLFLMVICLSLMILIPKLFPNSDGLEDNSLNLIFFADNVLPTLLIYLIIHYLVLPYWSKIKEWFNI